jgi:hypothetical protein
MSAQTWNRGRIDKALAHDTTSRRPLACWRPPARRGGSPEAGRSICFAEPPPVSTLILMSGSCELKCRVCCRRSGHDKSTRLETGGSRTSTRARSLGETFTVCGVGRQARHLGFVQQLDLRREIQSGRCGFRELATLSLEGPVAAQQCVQHRARRHGNPGIHAFESGLG